MRPHSDEELAQRAAAGDRSARDELLARHYGSILRLCKRLCSDPSRFDDVYQETLVAILRSVGSYRGDAAFTTWAYTVARTHHGRSMRADKRHLARADRFARHCVDSEGPCFVGDEMLATAELRERVRWALAQLASLDRDVVESRDILGCSAAETAAALGISIPAVKTRLHRARARLRALLGAQDVAEAAA